MRGLAYKWKVLIAVIFGIFMVILDSTVINVAFPTLRAEFNAGLSDSQWIISVYVMALGIATPLAGYLADRFGIKRTYVTGLALFVAGSLLCGVAPSLELLVVARALQGAGGGLALPLGTALLFGAFTLAEQGLAFGIFGIALVVAPALGPILGGWLVDQNLWRWIFFINVPIGLLGVLLASRFLCERTSERKPSFDLLGLITSSIGFGASLYAASIAADQGWTSRQVLTWFGVGALGLVAFTLVELFVARDPLLNLRLLRKRIFLVGTVVGYVSVLALFGAEFLLPLYLQSARGKTALETGVLLLPLAITSGIVTPLAGKLYDKIGARPLMLAGFGLLLLNTWQFSQLGPDTSITWILFLLAVRGAALGMTVQTTLVISLSVITQQEVARASSLSNATRQVVQSIGVAVLATVLASSLSPAVKAFQNQAQSVAVQSGSVHFGVCDDPKLAVPSAQGTPPSGVPSGGTAGGTPSAGGNVPPATISLLREACAQSIAGFERAYTLTFYFALAALLLGATLPGWPLRWSGRRSPARREEGAETAALKGAAGDAPAMPAP
jgi:DHA2 family multidrug resistance protein